MLAAEVRLFRNSPGACSKMLRVFKASGEEVLSIQFTEFVQMMGVGEQPARALNLKRHLQGLCGQPRFRQRLLLPDGQILPDDAVLNGPLDVQLVLLPFIETSKEQIHQLLLAAGQNNIPIVEHLLHRPQDPSQEFGYGAPLLIACANGAVAAVKILLEACADKDKANVVGETPLYIASQDDRVEIVRLLLEAHADKDMATKDGKTPLFISSCNGRMEVVQSLLQAKADKHKANCYGKSPMLVADRRGHREVIQLLMDA